MKRVIMSVLVFLAPVLLFASNSLSNEEPETPDIPDVPEVPEVEPSNTLPILYIETEDHTPVDQKETYVTAKAWLDASMTEEFESLGSADEPLDLGIRGRGNASWTAYKKPYKLKFDKKQGILGNAKNKHYVLLHYIGGYTSYFSEPLGFELGKRLGMAWTPNVEPIEVVLNGDYIGLYFLVESIRVDENRVNITEQADECDDPELVSTGWLVEIDNYADENQTVLYEPDGTQLRLTFHTPEVLSDIQLDYISNQFEKVIEAVHNTDKTSDEWLEYIDAESCAQVYIVNELLHNYDAYNGSFYLHKDDGDRWTFGPLWDLGYSLDKVTDTSIMSDLPPTTVPKLMPEILMYSEFSHVLREVWKKFYEEQGIDWADDFIAKWESKISQAAEHDADRWPGLARRDVSGSASAAAKFIKGNAVWFDTTFESTNVNDERVFGDLKIQLDGLNVRLDNTRGNVVNVYNVFGNRVLSTASCDFALPEKGIYILTCGEYSKKIAAF